MIILFTIMIVIPIISIGYLRWGDKRHVGPSIWSYPISALSEVFVVCAYIGIKIFLCAHK